MDESKKNNSLNQKMRSKSSRLSPLRAKNQSRKADLLQVESFNSSRTFKTFSTRDTKFDSKPSSEHLQSLGSQNNLNLPSQKQSYIASSLNEFTFSQNKSKQKKLYDSSQGSLLNIPTIPAIARNSNSTSAGDFSKEIALNFSKFNSIDNLDSLRGVKSKTLKKTSTNISTSTKIPLKASDDFLSIIASRLCLLDNEISNSSQPGPIDTNNSKLKKLKKSYFQFVKRFSRIEGVFDSVFIHSIVLAKKVKAALIDSFEFKPNEFMFIYAGCLFISIKYVIDSHKWFVEDFAKISKLKESQVNKMELFVLQTGLNFRVALLNGQYEKELQKTYRNVEKRKARLLNYPPGKK